jgi:primosomal protein N' (replication factor Y)
VATAFVLPHLPSLRLDLIAVAAADRWLHRPEYRASERALALLRMLAIAGRAQVLVESADPSHPVLRALTAPGLRPFYEEELVLRRELGYPPYRALAAVAVRGRTAASADAVAARLVAASTPGVEVLDPGPLRAPAAGRATRTLVVKAADRASIRELVWPVVTGDGVPAGVRAAVDVDPLEL